MALYGGARSISRTTTMSTVHRGAEFEQYSLRVLENCLSMSLRRVGGKSDGGIDLQGWWWLPTDDSSPDGHRRFRILAQCKREEKKVPPKYVREMEGVLHRYGVEQSSATHAVTPPAVGVLISASAFSKMAIIHAHTSPLPLILLHLRVPDQGMQPEPAEPAAKDSEAALSSISLNPALGGRDGLLRGQCEARWEYLVDRAAGGRLGLWWKGERMKSWTPEADDSLAQT